MIRNIENRKCMKTSHTTDWPCSAYEKPTPMGWSTKKTLALLFHDFLKNVGSSVALVTRQGPKFQKYAVAKIERIRMPIPNSMRSPRDEEQPGPKIGLSVTQNRTDGHEAYKVPVCHTGHKDGIKNKKSHPRLSKRSHRPYPGHSYSQKSRRTGVLPENRYNLCTP